MRRERFPFFHFSFLVFLPRCFYLDLYSFIYGYCNLFWADDKIALVEILDEVLGRFLRKNFMW